MEAIMTKTKEQKFDQSKGWNNLSRAIWMEICFQLSCQFNDDNFNMYDRELFYNLVVTNLGEKTTERTWQHDFWGKIKNLNRAVPVFDNTYSEVRGRSCLKWFITIKLYKNKYALREGSPRYAKSKSILFIQNISPLLTEAY